MKQEDLPDHLRIWWSNQYETVQEFLQILLHEDAADPRLRVFFERLSVCYPKMRSVRMTNALHSLWRSVDNERAFELALKHCASPTALNEFERLTCSALANTDAAARFGERFNDDSPITDVTSWLEALAREAKSHNAVTAP